MSQVSIVQEIERAAARFSSRDLLTELRLDDPAAASTFSYGQIYERSLRLASGLARAGLRPGDRLAVLMDNSADMVTSEWACLLCGFLWVTLNVRSANRELEDILADSLPAVLIVGSDHAARTATLRLPADCCVVQAGPELEALLGSPEAPYPPPGAEGPVRIRYTSGTSGRPKGAVLVRRCYDASVSAVEKVIGPISAEGSLLQVAPMTHASGAMLFPHAKAGAKAYLLDRFEAGLVAKIIEARSISSIFVVPTMLVRLLSTPAAGTHLASLRTIVYGGASMPVDRLRDGLELLGPVFVQIYGLTESTWPVAALGRHDHLRREAEGESEESWVARLSSVGLSSGVGEIRVVDEAGTDLGTDLAGEILVKGPNTMTGYWSQGQDVDDGKGLDADGWMRTGDIGRCDPGGYLTIVDRLDDMIVTGGFNVYPREVEDALASHPDVIESAVVARDDPDWGQRVHACVVLEAGRSLDAAALIEHVAGRLAGYKKPRTLELVDSLPRNPAGKLLRRELR